MKKLILKAIAVVTFIVFIIAAAGFKQVAKEKILGQKDLVGVWEMLYNGKPTGVLKIIGSDGSLVNIVSTPKGFLTTLTGSFEITSDSTYIEKIEKSINSFLSGTSNEITYKMDNTNNMMIRFLVKEKTYIESYRKVPFAIGF